MHANNMNMLVLFLGGGDNYGRMVLI